MRDIAVAVVRNPDGPRFRKESGAKLLYGPKAPKPYQGECFDQLVSKQHRIIDIPTAAGKSVIMMALATHDAMNGLKPIIVVPQLSIGLGFKSDHFILPSTNEDILWQTYEPNFLIGNTTTSSIERVITYLKNPIPRDPACAHLVTTHQTISQVYAQLRKEKSTKLFKKLSLFLDEGHHARSDKYVPNGMGEMTRFVSKKQCSKVTLVTATNFRTDSMPIAPADLVEFSLYGLPYDQYIKYKSIGSLGFQFRLFNDEPGVDAGNLVRGFLNNGERSIIYVPVTSHSFYDVYGYSKNKQKMKTQIVEEILTGISPRTKWVEDNHFWTGMVNGKKVRVVDLIDDESNRRAKVDYINITKDKIEEGVDVIIAMSMFKEGSDYPLLQHAIVIEPRGSLGEVIQMFGRVMRDDVQVKKGRKYAKNHVSFTYLLSAPHEDYEQFSRYMNALVQAMLLIDVMEPILVATGIDKSKKKKKKRDDIAPTVPTLPELFGDPEIAERVFHNILEAITLNDKWGEISTSERQEKMTEFVQEQIDIHNVVIPSDITIKDVANKAYAMLVRNTLPVGVRNDIIVDPELIYKHAPLSYFSKAMGKEFFERYRKLLEIRVGVDSAKARTRECAAYRKKYGKYPLALTALGGWRGRMIMAKAGKGACTWHPVCYDIAKELGCPDMFEYEPREQMALDKVRLVVKYKKKYGKYPPKFGHKLGKWWGRMISARTKREAGISITREATWYPSCLELAIELGCPDMFDIVDFDDTRLQAVLEFTRDTAQYKKDHNKYPRSGSGCTPLGQWLNRMRRAKAGKKGVSGNWYPQCEKLAKELGCSDMFIQPGSPEARMAKGLDWVRRIAEHKKTYGSYPASNKKGGPNGRWLSHLRRAKRGTGAAVWFDEYQKLAKQLGCPDMFFSLGSALPNARKQKSLDRTKEVARYKKKHGIYPPATKDSLLGRWLASVRRAKAGFPGTHVWYSECEKLAKQLRCPDMFDYRK